MRRLQAINAGDFEKAYDLFTCDLEKAPTPDAAFMRAVRALLALETVRRGVGGCGPCRADRPGFF